MTCNEVNAIAKINVKKKPKKVSYLLANNIEWCAHVIVAPDNNRIKVFTNGTSQGSKGCIPLGGQIAPNSIVGARAEWKKSSKKTKKKHNFRYYK